MKELLFCGKYIESVKNNKIISLAFDFQGQTCDIWCLKTGNEMILVICPSETPVDEYRDLKVIKHYKISVSNKFVLPDVFLEYLMEEKQVAVVGVGDKVEINKCSICKDIPTETEKEYINKIIQLENL